jgi:hypothetical protein
MEEQNSNSIEFFDEALGRLCVLGEAKLFLVSVVL